MRKTSAYADELRTQTDRVAEVHPEVAVFWRANEVVFPKAGEDGFEVSVQPESGGLIVLTDVGLHVHIGGDPDEAVGDALGPVRDLLSPDMRVVEQRAGRRGYRWTLERLDTGRWVRVATTGQLFWNYFAGRSERIYQNRRLRGRLAYTMASEG